MVSLSDVNRRERDVLLMNKEKCEEIEGSNKTIYLT